MLFAQSNLARAEKLFSDGKYSEARPVFETILASNPSDLKVLEYLGDIAGHAKSWDAAIKYYGKLRQLKPYVANYQYKFGGALGMKAKNSNKFKALMMIDEVKEAFETAAKLDPKHIDTRWALVMLYLELPEIVGGSESKAQKYAAELYKLSPVDGYLSRGQIEEYFERYIAAEQQYKKAIAVGGSKTCYQKLASLYKNKMNEPEKADLILQKINH